MLFKELSCLFIITNILFKVYITNTYTYLIIINLFKSLIIETLLFLLILLIISIVKNEDNVFDHYNFLKKYKPIVNNLKQLHFYKRKTCVIKDGRIHRFNDTYE
jgi:hypothetical protein